MGNDTKNLLCHGYVKNNYIEYITTDIVRLISQYVSDILEDIKNASDKQVFYTSIVSIKSFKWYLKLKVLAPKVQNENVKRYFQIFLCLESMPSELKWVKVYWKLRLKE